MTRPHVPFLAFLLLFLMTVPFSLDVATSVVPGWHSTIFPPYFIWTSGVMIALLFVIIGYWRLAKRTEKTNWAIFAIHFLLSVGTVIYLRLPTIFLKVDMRKEGQLRKTLEFRMGLIPFAWALFTSGQVVFLIYYIRTIRDKRLEHKPAGTK